MSTRREFFRRAAAATGGASMMSALLAPIERALAIDPPAGGSFLDAEHVVILMQENRSFDHMFGSLRGVRGFNDPRAVTLPDRKPVWLQTNAAGETYAPFRLDIRNTKATWLGSLPHSWVDQTDARNHGNHDGWLEAKRSHRQECADMPLTMGYYTREDLPFYYAFADAFTICDQHFCSSLTGTTPNRLHLWTGAVREKQEAAFIPAVRNSEVDYGATVSWKTFPERLEESGVSWRVYQNEVSIDSGLEEESDAWLANFTDNPLEWFDQYHVGFRRTHLEYVDKLLAALPAQIAKLRAGGPEKEVAAKEKLLQYAKSEKARWTPQALARLSDRERSLHDKAFTTNEEDAGYRQLSSLRYRRDGVEREMAIPKGDPLYRFRQDVDGGKLPAVSWLVASERFSDHPGSPWYGAWYVAETLNILTRNPEVWKKTIFILTYDENDGYFDHVPPFVAPEPGNPESGKTSPGIDAASEYLPLELDLKRRPAQEARGGPIGLGYRVPLLVASPWSRGGYVCSQVFDHTSVLQLLERVIGRRSGKQIRETNISAWRRAICGDLSAAFRPFQGDRPAVRFPSRDSFYEQVHLAQFTPLPTGYRKLTADDTAPFQDGRPTAAWMPRQEPGVRPSTALPYELVAHGALNADGTRFEIELETGPTTGAPFRAYTPGKFRGRTEQRTRDYAVAARERLTDSWDLKGFENGVYHLRVCGPNGFLREFAGGADDPRLEIRCEYVRRNGVLTGGVELRVTSQASHVLKVQIRDHGYKTPSRTMSVEPGGEQRLRMALERSHHWYDFSLTISGADAFLRRFAGRVETGKSGFSDPAMA